MRANITDLPVKHVNFRPFDFPCATFEDAYKMAEAYANSSMAGAYKGRPADIMVIWQTGAEMGLGKAQSMRTFGCFDGKVFAYGDGKWAQIVKHPEFEDAKEWFEGDIEKGTLTAFCTIKRKDREPLTRSFSMGDAKQAELWNKKGTWQLYKKRMLQHRARGLASNDAFPDAFYGIPSEQEVYDMIDVTPVIEAPKASGKGLAALEGALGIGSKFTESTGDSNISTETVIEGEVIQTELSPLEKIKLLMKDKKAAAAVASFLTRSKIATIDELQADQIQKILIHLTKKEI